MQIFSHSIELEGHGRSAAWEALQKVARHPEWVVAGCEKAVVSEISGPDGRRWLKRVKDFGGMAIEDSVCLEPEGHAEVHVAAGESWPRSWQEIDLEETAGGVRFTFAYSQEQVQELDNPRYAELRNEAYRNKDRALVDLVAKLAKAA